MNTTTQVGRRYKITLDLDEIELHDLYNSICEATGYVDNWRSNPEPLWQLNLELGRNI